MAVLFAGFGVLLFLAAGCACWCCIVGVCVLARAFCGAVAP